MYIVDQWLDYQWPISAWKNISKKFYKILNLALLVFNIPVLKEFDYLGSLCWSNWQRWCRKILSATCPFFIRIWIIHRLQTWIKVWNCVIPFFYRCYGRRLGFYLTHYRNWIPRGLFSLTSATARIKILTRSERSLSLLQ